MTFVPETSRPGEFLLPCSFFLWSISVSQHQGCLCLDCLTKFTADLCLVHSWVWLDRVCPVVYSIYLHPAYFVNHPVFLFRTLNLPCPLFLALSQAAVCCKYDYETLLLPTLYYAFKSEISACNLHV